MIDLSFLKSPGVIGHKFSGMEYMDWQTNSTVFNQLVAVLSEAYIPAEKRFDFGKGIRERLSSVIKENLQMTVEMVVSEGVIAAVDTGFINPGNVIDQSQYLKWVDKKYSKIAEAFKELKKDVIRGYADPVTGKLEGDFKSIPFSIFIDPSVVHSMDEKVLLKLGVTVPEGYAAFILHECGHIFGGLLYISSKVLDNAVMSQGIRMYMDESDTLRKTTIIKDTLKELGAIGELPTDEMSEEEVIIYFSKNLVNRDYRRSLSLGVSTMSFEVLADAYAIRFGAGKPLLASLKSFGFLSTWTITKISAFFAIIMAFIMQLPIAPLFIIYFAILSIGNQFDILTSSIYDSPYRRLKNILRETITHYNTVNGSKTAKAAILSDLKKMEMAVEEHKTFFESTGLQRTLGWLRDGSDFRKKDFEHYTADLAATRLTVFGENYFTS